jgi:hypothetical protein
MISVLGLLRHMIRRLHDEDTIYVLRKQYRAYITLPHRKRVKLILYISHELPSPAASIYEVVNASVAWRFKAKYEKLHYGSLIIITRCARFILPVPVLDYHPPDFIS